MRVDRGRTGAPLPDALLTMDPELWDPQRRRITVLFDPARLKRGLAPAPRGGVPVARRRGRLSWSSTRAMRDARGVALGVDTRHRFSVGPRRPEPRRPVGLGRRRRRRRHARSAAGVVRSRARPRAARALPDRRRRARRDRGGHVDAPRTPTRRGRSSPPTRGQPRRTPLVVDPILEDVCGNSVTRVFDRDLADPAHTRGPDHPVVLPFHPALTAHARTQPSKLRLLRRSP